MTQVSSDLAKWLRSVRDAYRAEIPGMVSRAIREAADQARAEAIEECAKIAENAFIVDGNDNIREFGQWRAARDIAKTLRVLLPKENG